MKYFFAIIVVALGALGIPDNSSVEPGLRNDATLEQKQEIKTDGGTDLPPGAMPVQLLEFQPMYINTELKD